MLLRYPSEEGLLDGRTLLVAVVDKGTSSDNANDTECGTSVDAAVRLLLSMGFFGNGRKSQALISFPSFEALGTVSI